MVKVVERLPVFDALPVRAASQGLRRLAESTCAELLAELAPEAAWHGTPMLRALAQAHAPPRLVCIGGYNSNWNRHEPVLQQGDAAGCEISAEVVCSLTGDEQSSRWRCRLPPMLHPRADVAVVSGPTRGTLFALGGRHGEQRHSSVERLDLLAWQGENRGWQMMPSMLESRSGLAASVMGGGLIVAGGRSSTKGVLREVEFWQPGGEWTLAPSMQQPREYAACVTVDDEFWALGGGETGRSSTVEIWNAESAHWRWGPELREKRYGASAVWHKGRIYLVGGSHHFRKRKLTTLECLDPREGTWESHDLTLEGPGYQCSLWGSGIAAFENTLFVCGGAFRDLEESLNTVYSIDLRTLQLKQLSLGGEACQLEVPRWCGGACIV